MKKLILIVILLSCFVLGFIWFNKKQVIINPLGKGGLLEKPLDIYTFANLRQISFSAQPITFGKDSKDTDGVITKTFYFFSPKRPESDKMDKNSGVINFPNKSGTYPVIIMLRGYVPDESYLPGVGTQRVAEILAKNGYITLAPDFLGFGESASPSADAFESRFQTYVTVLSLLSSIKNLNDGLKGDLIDIKADTTKLGLWGHSNGGHIALVTLELTGGKYPTVLWAPVSKSFPYSILYYTDEFDDQGKALRKTLADFEKDYDTEKYSLQHYLTWIKAPIQIHQGQADQEVPVWWSDELVDVLKKQKIDVQYFTYPGADHNLLPSGWSAAVQNSITFYSQHFEKQ